MTTNDVEFQKNLVFTITVEGVYRHEILGIYTKLKKAISEAIRAIKLQPDNYHRIQIGYMHINKRENDLDMLIVIGRDEDGIYTYGTERRIKFRLGKIVDSTYKMTNIIYSNMINLGWDT